MSRTLDVIIIGSGTAGLSALREVRNKTDDFLLINEGSWGTTCAAVGCMPSKALIESAKAFHRRLDFDAFGLSVETSWPISMVVVFMKIPFGVRSSAREAFGLQ